MAPSVLLALALLAAPVKAASPVVFGFNLPCWWVDCYELPITEQSIEKMAATGAGWVALVPTWHLNGKHASEIRRTMSTPSDEGLRKVIRQARSLNVKVMLKPHIDDSSGGTFRGFIDAADPGKFFDEYRAMLNHYAKLAAEEQADVFVVGTELYKMTAKKHEHQWRRTIREARSHFSGPMTYAANWYDAPLVPFWDALDFIGVDAYYPLVLGPGKGAIKNSWRPYVAMLKALSQRHGKSIVFTEIGAAAQRGSPTKPWAYWNFAPLDLEIQKLYFEALIEVFEPEPWFRGFLVWGWEIDPKAGGPKDPSMTPMGKPAMQPLERYFRKLNPQMLQPRPQAMLMSLQMSAPTFRFDGR